MTAAVEAVDHTPAVLTFVGVLVTALASLAVAMIVRADSRSRKDHNTVIGVVNDIRDDVRDVKADVRELKASDRTQAARLDNLEQPDRIRRIH